MKIIANVFACVGIKKINKGKLLKNYTNAVKKSSTLKELQLPILLS